MFPPASSAGPSSASVSSAGTTPGANVSATALASNATSSAVGASVISASGPAIPSLDPTLTGALNWGHLTTPQSSAFVTGTNSLIQRQSIGNFGIQKGFLTGTIVSLGLNNTSVTSNNPRNDFNPSTNSSLALSFTQHLLQGFGTALNSRQIHIAKNNREVSDLTFKLQVETTVAAVMELYWDLVSFNEAVQVGRDALAASQQLLENNRKQVEVGTLAQIEVVRAEAEIASREQTLVVSQTRALQQETIIKTALSRTGVASPAIAAAHIITTDRIRVPDVEPITPIQDMTAMALSARPELAQSRIQLANQQLTIRGSKNGLLPTLDVVANVSNGALAGDINPLPAPPGTVHSNTGVLHRRLRHGALAVVRAQLPELRRRSQPQHSDPQPCGAGAVGLRRTDLPAAATRAATPGKPGPGGRAERLDWRLAGACAYIAAQKAQVLQAQTLDAETKKLALGASTIYNQILAERDLVTAQSNLVTAEAAYARAKVELDRATGQILYNNNVSLDEAYKGVVARPPSAIPDTPPAARAAPTAVAGAETEHEVDTCMPILRTDLCTLKSCV